MQRLRSLTEAECYLRCYGWVGNREDSIRILHPHAADDHEGAAVLFERIRREYEEQIAAREAEAA